MTKAVITKDSKSVTATYVEATRDSDGRLIATGTLKRGLKIGSSVHKEFLLREAITGDLLAAEQQSRTETVLNFSAAVLARQLVRIGSFEGPFTVGMLSELRAYDFGVLRNAQLEIDAVGEFIE